MKKLSVFLVFIFFTQNISFGYIEREMEFRKEKIIPFSYNSDSSTYSTDLSIRGLNNVEIEDIYVDNGDVKTKIDGKYIELNFSGGSITSGKKNVIKTGTYELKEVALDKEGSFTINTDKEVISIDKVSGDFLEAKVNSGGDIELKIKSEANGVLGYNKGNIITSRFRVNVDSNNRERKIESNEVILSHNPIGNIKPISGDTSSVQAIDVNENKVKITFDYGIPKANETSVKSGYTYCWVDRDENGNFKEYKPNSVYSTDINKITGLGEYLDYNDYDEIGLSLSNPLWEDYVGTEVNGVRYIYVYDKNKGIPEIFEGNLINGDSICINEQNFNSEKYTVKFSNADVSYIPEGKLYSMGDLVENTLGWGEVYPNNANESKKTFFNQLTGKYETYVRHFKFFYGPYEKETFGGYYTYPYTCEFEYSHYEPVKYYSGEIVYSYSDTVDIDGYLYNGWLKISYDEKRNVNDYPPTSPFNIKYNAINGKLSWNHGSDDYTPENKLIYEIEIFEDDWKLYKRTLEGVNLDNCPLNLPKDKIRIRTIDEVGQVSLWAYGKDSDIELTGNVVPYIVKPCEKINISAIVNSFSEVESVTAENAELKMYAELQRMQETSSDFFEMSYDLEADFLEDDDEYIVVSNSMSSKGNKKSFDVTKFRISDKFYDDTVNINTVEDITFNKNGTLIFSNQNYLDTPMYMFQYDKRNWHLEWNNRINIINRVTKNEELFFSVENFPKKVYVKSKASFVPTTRIKVNKFEYDHNGTTTYDTVEIGKELAGKPFVIRWKTDILGITEFSIFFENELVYKYDVLWEDINRYVDKICSVNMYKKINNYMIATYGYIESSKSRPAIWPKIVLKTAIGRNLQDFLWLGYRVRTNEYIKEEYVEGYNSNPQVRNNYRMLVVDDEISDLAIKRYIEFLKTSNIAMTRDKNTVWGDDVLQYTSMFEAKNIVVPEGASPGRYDILVTAEDLEGNLDSIILNLIVEEEENEEIEDDKEGLNDNEENEENKVSEILECNIGRFFYKDGSGYLEELKQTDKTLDTNGFICAGETLGFIIKAKDTEYIEVDFVGDSSIKTFDNLTKKFLVDNPSKYGKSNSNLEKEYKVFPLRIYPHSVDKSGNTIFSYFYTIPYATKQSLESWSSLKNSTLEKIDKTRLFDRKNKPYEIVIYLNGDREKSMRFKFDVFERWDTILNRDIRQVVINSDTRWEMRVDK